MKGNIDFSRRRFMQSTGALTGASLLRIGVPSLAAIAQTACTAKTDGAAFVTLGAEEAADFAAIAARIIPTTDTPGASEAGVIWFWDNVLGNAFSWVLEDVRELRVMVNDGLEQPFAEVSAEQQDAVLRGVEDDGRFELCRLLTICGFFAMAKHGGNKDHLSWDLVGFDGHHGAWSPPFGYYDAEYAKEQTDGE